MKSDGELIIRAQAGDEAAKVELLERHRLAAIRVAVGFVGRDDAEDVVQDAWWKAYQGLASYQGKGSFEGWLIRIVKNQAKDELRKRKRRPTEKAESLERPRKSSHHQSADTDYSDGAESQDEIDAGTEMVGIAGGGDPALLVECLGDFVAVKQDEWTSVPAKLPHLAAAMFLSALAWPETNANGHRQRDRCMTSLAHLCERKGRKLSKSPNRLTMTQREQSNTLRMVRKRLQRRIDCASVAIFVLARFKGAHGADWTMAAAAKGKSSRPSWYRDVWAGSLPVLHLAWTFRGEIVRRELFAIETDDDLADLVLRPEWAVAALKKAERLAGALPRIVRRGERVPFLNLPPLVRLIAE